MVQNVTSNQGLILQRYKRIKQLYETNRKEIWLIENINSGERCIMKCHNSINQSVNNPTQRTILHQANFLHSMQGHLGFPFMIWSGQENQKQLLLVEELGDSITYLYEIICERKFTLKTVCMIGMQVLKIIQDYHGMGYVHRRILPRTIQLGKKNKNHIIFINDLFDSKKYTNQKTNKHLQLKKNSKLSSHLSSFTTLNQILTGQSSRRDDIEAIIIILIYFLKGKLPWQQIIEKYSDNNEKLEKLKSALVQTKAQIICQGLPNQFVEMLKKVRGMSFIQQPNYPWFLQQIERMMYKNNYRNDYIYDWIKIESQKGSKRLKVDKIIPAIQLCQDQNLLQKYYFPYQQLVDIDQVTQKFKSKQQIQEEIILSDNSADCGSKRQKKNKKGDCLIM